MKDVSYLVKETNVAEIFVKGVPYKFRVPPVTGTHSECFQALNQDTGIGIARGKEIAVYAAGALDPSRKNEWLNQDLIRFPSQNYLRVPAVLTMVPKRRAFGDLEGGMLIDSDLKGEGIMMNTEVPKDLSGWTLNQFSLLIKENRIFIPYAQLYKEQWNEDHGAAIAFFEREGAEMLVRARIDSGRTYAPLWKVNVNSIKNPEKRLPVLGGFGDLGLYLDCSYLGDGGGGCAAGVYNSAEGAAQKI